MRPGLRLLCACALLSACTSTTLRPHPDLAAQLPPSRAIAIMPVESAALDVGYLGAIDMVEPEAAAAAQAVVQAIQRRLAARGRPAAVARVDEELFQREPESRLGATELQLAADRAMGRVLRTQTPEKREEYFGVRSVLAELAPFAADTHADALLFTRATLLTTRNEYGLVSYAGEVEIVLIDASTGEVLYAGDASTRSHFHIDVGALAVAALGSL